MSTTLVVRSKSCPIRQSTPASPKVWSPCACVTKIFSMREGRTPERCKLIWVPSPASNIQNAPFRRSTVHETPRVVEGMQLAVPMNLSSMLAAGSSPSSTVRFTREWSGPSGVIGGGSVSRSSAIGPPDPAAPNRSLPPPPLLPLPLPPSLPGSIPGPARSSPNTTSCSSGVAAHPSPTPAVNSSSVGARSSEAMRIRPAADDAP
mmetsp:Transcript_11946/g.32221  ORF Transcript_11946/g.32221 Transcript_11946/m.32221 type:complete len:205 (-) Transcript_11946:717-1331(-)